MTPNLKSDSIGLKSEIGIKLRTQKGTLHFFQSWPHSSSHILRQSAASGLRSHSDKISVLVDLVSCFLSFAKTGNGARRPPERMAAFKTSMVPIPLHYLGNPNCWWRSQRTCRCPQERWGRRPQYLSGARMEKLHQLRWVASDFSYVTCNNSKELYSCQTCCLLSVMVTNLFLL